MVFKRLFGRLSSAEAAPATWHIPAGQRFYAVGDIHGRLDLLNDLIDRIDADNAARGPAEPHIVFLGDLVDRGPDSRGVVERVMGLVRDRPHVRCVGGNHEDLLLHCHSGDVRAAPTFHRVGGRETVLSYGVSEADYDNAGFEALVKIIKAAVPQAHIDFLSGLSDWVRAGDYLFVHAGLNPRKPLDLQSREDMRWIRREFTEDDSDHGMMVIHGHTITEQVDERSNRIGIDTGAYATGRLTAIGLEGDERWFLATEGAPG
jgi:serine/threonine protein phosphatase 1